MNKTRMDMKKLLLKSYVNRSQIQLSSAIWAHSKGSLLADNISNDVIQQSEKWPYQIWIQVESYHPCVAHKMINGKEIT